MSVARLRLLVLALLAAACLGGGGWYWWSVSWHRVLPWRDTAPGMAVCAWHRAGMGQPVTITAVRADPARCRIQVVHTLAQTHGAGATADAVCPPDGAAINASFFAGESLAPIGLLIADGRHLGSYYVKDGMYGPWGLFQLRGRRPELIALTPAEPTGVTQAVQCAPRLVVAGQVQPFRPLPAARRAAVGLDAAGRVCVAVADRPITFPDWAACLRDQLGCREALNLDGGPSAQLAVRGGVMVDVRGGVNVPVFLAITPGSAGLTAP